MPVCLSISSLTFSGGDTIDLKPNSVVVFVGPNNAGKTTALNEVFTALSDGRPRHVLKRVDWEFPATKPELWSWMKENVFHFAEWGKETKYQRFGASASESQLTSAWQGHRDRRNLGALAAFLCSQSGALQRLQTANETSAYDVLRQPPSQPLQYLLQFEELENRVSEITQEAFGFPIVVDRGPTNRVHVYCGVAPTRTKREDRSSASYRSRLFKLPLLSEQGDGVKSFIGCVLAATTSGAFIRLIDEPEVFLHPPHARYLGKLLCQNTQLKEAWRGSKQPFQLFIATHSSDFLRGVLDSSAQNVVIVRITRDGAVNRAKALRLGKMNAHLSNPLLRHSNVLDALFHDVAIVCEADTDCRFYGAVAESLLEGTSDTKRTHALFTWGGGKDRIPKIVSSLREFGVPARAVVDIDVFANQRNLRDLIESMGALWSEFERDWKILGDSLTKGSAAPKIKEVRSVIDRVLPVGSAGQISRDQSERIREATKFKSKWDDVKTAGLAAIPSGQPQEAAVRLITKLRTVGIHVVPVGQLESWDRTVSNHGVKWVSEVLSIRDILKAPELKEAREFVANLMSQR
ncbi:MAG: AAA family ATPase [Planctomycetes bacterium]|nr:AAA family ATPase [Planctomycetota bacterium]